MIADRQKQAALRDVLGPLAPIISVACKGQTAYVEFDKTATDEQKKSVDEAIATFDWSDDAQAARDAQAKVDQPVKTFESSVGFAYIRALCETLNVDLNVVRSRGRELYEEMVTNP